MKKIIIIVFSFFIIPDCILAHSTEVTIDSTNTNTWNYNVNANFYFLSDDFFVNPVVTADHNWLHLEARYNYEDFRTTSVFAGYNFSFGNELKLEATSLLGAAFGNTKGIIPGLEATLSYKKWELYDETEWLISPGDHANNFLYSWTDLTYSLLEKFYFGLSAQRTRLHETALDLQRGIVLGYSRKIVNLSGYIFNPGREDVYFVLSAGISF